MSTSNQTQFVSRYLTNFFAEATEDEITSVLSEINPAIIQVMSTLIEHDVSIKEIVDMGDQIDIIFDLSGNEETRKQLREQLEASNNNHTVIAPENVARLVWSLITNKPLPDVHEKKGY